MWGGKNKIKYCTDCILLGSHQSYPHSHPLHHTSRPGVYKECCCTGSHLKGSGVELRKQKNEEEITFKSVINLLLCENVDLLNTSTVAVLLIAAIDAVNVGVTAPAERNAVSALAWKLGGVTLQITAMLKMNKHSNKESGFIVWKSIT